MATPDEQIFLSGTRETQSRANLFRPKELREVVFPGLGMIMHSLFWVKHSFYLGEHGYPIDKQNEILLWASGEDVEYTESLLFYCVYSNMATAGEMRVNAGQRTTRDWLFRRDSDRDGSEYAQLSENLRSLAEQSTAPDYEAFIDASFASWFRTRCNDSGIDLVAELQETIGPALNEPSPKETERALAGGFATAVGRLVREHPTLRSGKDLQVISTTAGFAQRVYETATPAQRATLANTRLEITPDEATALLEVVSQMKNGEHFLRSLMFILYLGPIDHSQDEIEQQMRHLYDFVLNDPQSIIEEVRGKYSLSVIDGRASEDLDATAFYWVLNFFMADGETIARDLLEDTTSPITVDDVRAYFTEHPKTAERFRSFFDYTANCRPYLSQLLSELKTERATRTAVFVEVLIKGLEEEPNPAELFLKLLVSQDTIVEKAPGQYLIETQPKNTNEATFYGIGPLISWAKTLTVALQS